MRLQWALRAQSLLLRPSSRQGMWQLGKLRLEEQRLKLPSSCGTHV
jgi:hypothetical protein